MAENPLISAGGSLLLVAAFLGFGSALGWALCAVFQIDVRHRPAIDPTEHPTAGAFRLLALSAHPAAAIAVLATVSILAGAAWSLLP